MIGLFSLVWFLVILGIPAQLPLQLASWLTFIGLLMEGLKRSPAGKQARGLE